MEQKQIQLGQIQINNVLQRKISIIGGTGSGKTTSLKMLALKSKEAGIHTFIFDPLNVIYIDGFNRILITKKSKEKGKELGILLNKLSHKDCVIIAFKDMLQEEMASFCDAVFAVWNAYDDMICFDEIHEFVPRIQGEPSQEVNRAIRHWRNKDCGFIFTSQRVSMVNTNVIALTDYLVVLRTTWKNDLVVLEELLGNISKEESKAVLSKVQTFPFLCGYSIDFRYTDQKQSLH